MQQKQGKLFLSGRTQGSVIITEQISSRIICEDATLLLGKAFSSGARPWLPPALCTGSHTASALAQRLLAFDITAYHKASTVLRLVLLKKFNWTDTFAEAFVVWNHLKSLLFPFHFQTNGQHTSSSGTIAVDTRVGLKLLANSNSFLDSYWKVACLLSRLKSVWAMVLQQIKSGQFIFANYRVLWYVILAKYCNNLPFLSKPVNTLEMSLFSEQLWSNVLFH